VGLPGAAGCSGLLCCVLRSLREKLDVRKKRSRKERRKKRKEKKRKKEKNTEKISNLKIFREKNKRQFMKVVKIIFVQESYMSNYN
jgi:hypothetical protein